MASLWEGFTANVGTALRSYFSRTPQRQAAELQRGGIPAVSMAGMPYNLVTQFGYDALANYLRIDQDLQQRYTDVEEMDEYPELTCLVQETSIALPRGYDKDADMGIASDNCRSIGELAKDYEEGRHERLLVYAFDHEAGKVVVAEAKGPVKTGRRQVYKVTYEEYRGREHRRWSIKATYDHLFMLRDGSYRAAIDLEPGDRLMPCTFKVDANGYLAVYEPMETVGDGNPTYAAVHRLVARALCGRELEEGDVVHHRNGDKTDPSPSNLEIMRRGSHVRVHLADMEAEARRRQAIAQTVSKKWDDPQYRKRLSEAHDRGGGQWLANDGRRQPRGILSDEHRAAIGRASRIPLAKDVVEAAVRASASFNAAAKSLGVSWNTLMRRVALYEIDRSILGANLGAPQQGDAEYLNHRVVSVEVVGEEDVYDLEVPGYRNFAAGDGDDGFVFVHNCGLDIYADDATTPDLDREQSIWAVSEDKKVADELNHMLHKQLLVEDDIWGMVRTLCKYGNVFGEALVTDQGLVGLNYLPPPTVRRVEGPRGQLLGFIQDIRGEFNISLEDFYTLAAQQQMSREGKGPGAPAAMGRKPGELTVFEDWELIHWRLRGKHLRSVYGNGVVDPARWIWKRLALLEDALLIYKLERAPARYAFYIDVGELDAERGLAFVNRVKNSFTRQKFVNPSTGKLDMRFNPLAMDEDFFVPVRAGKRTTEIDVISGPDYSETETLEYHRDKLVSSIKIPKTYMGYGGESTRNALSSEDIRFARTEMRIQRATRSGYRQASRIHLIAKGVKTKADYDVRMNVPSQILELARVEVMSATADLASRMKEDVGTKWVLTHIYKFSEDEAAAVMKERSQEDLDRGAREAQIEKMRMEGMDPAEQRQAILNGDLDVRLSRLMTAVAKKDWRRSFEGSRGSDKKADDKLSRLLKENRDTGRRLKELGGLMGEIRGALRSAAPPML